MKSFSLSRVLQYARYHYTTMQSKYMVRLLLLVGLPLFIGVLSRNVVNTTEVSAVVCFFASFGVASLCVHPMRDRGQKILEMGVPVSNEERMAFFLLNLGVIYPLIAHIAAFVLALLVSLLDQYSYCLGDILRELHDCGYGDWWFYVTIQFFAAGTLLINLLARRSVFIAYLIAFFSFIALFLSVSWVLGLLSEMGVVFNNTIYITPQMFEDVVEPIIKVVYSLLPACIYAVCYVVSRKRQMKW